VFENRVIWRIFGPKGDDVTENGGSCTMRIFIIYTHFQIQYNYADQMKENEVGGVCGRHGRGRKSAKW
jgi:hypothetical protein